MNALTLRAAKLCALLATTSLSTFCAQPATAQEELGKRDPLPAEQYSISPGGVDMRTGQYAYSHTDLSIGGASGLSLVRDNGILEPEFTKPFGSFSHNWDIFLTEKMSGLETWQNGQPVPVSWHISVHAGGRSQSFTSDQPRGTMSLASSTVFARLVWSGSGSSGHYLYTASGGTAITFSVGGGPIYASRIVEPDGTRYDLQYDSVSGVPGARLRRVTSNLGHALILEYSTAAGQQKLVSKACVLNLAVAPAPVAHVCPANARTATYTYQASKDMASYTEPTGAVHTFSTGVGGSSEVHFFRPGESSPWLVNQIGAPVDGATNAVTRQTFADGRTFDYTWGGVPHGDGETEIAGGTYRLNGGPPVEVGFGRYTWPKQEGFRVSPAPARIVDELGRTSTADYCYPHSAGFGCGVGPVRSWTLPAGNSIHFTYDFYRNLTETRRKAKPGSGLADIVTTAGGFQCTSALLCAKPGWTKDANGNQTDYTYDPVHGGMLTETGPALIGIRPQKRFTYAQRYAWVSNGAGGYVAAATPVWVLTQESFCKSGAASGSGCAIAGDEVITTYDYGPNSGPNNLLLRGKVVDAGGLNLRTCYGYDSSGNKISETAPRAGLSSCS